MTNIRVEMDKAIKELEQLGINKDSHTQAQTDKVGLGDKIEEVLTSLGITEQKFKNWFNLKECNCSKRKAWLNSLFSWKKNQ